MATQLFLFIFVPIITTVEGYEVFKLKIDNNINFIDINNDSIEHILFRAISTSIDYGLFLDIDGTLADFNINPNECFIPKKTLDTLSQLIKYNIPVIAVTGRDIHSAQKLFQDLNLPIAALHGLEIYLNKTDKLIHHKEIDTSEAYKNLIQECQAYPALLIENKKASIALHYRQCPDLELTAKNIIQKVQHNFPNFKVISGKYVFELISPHANKGRAIETILEYMSPSHKFSPIFIGDDVTDEDGFQVINQIDHGISIKVGQGPTHAKYKLTDIQQVSHFLELFLHQIKSKNSNVSHSNKLNGEKTCLN